MFLKMFPRISHIQTQGNAFFYIFGSKEAFIKLRVFKVKSVPCFAFNDFYVTNHP